MGSTVLKEGVGRGISCERGRVVEGMNGEASRNSSARAITEVPRPSDGKIPPGIPEGRGLVSWVHPEWEARFPWLAQGTTGRMPLEGSGDFSLFRETGPPASRVIWEELMQSLGFPGAVHSHQLHGVALLSHQQRVRGLELGEPADGHITRVPGVLLAVTVADCTPVFLVDPETRGAALLHAGWRSTVGGILRDGVERLGSECGAKVEDLFLHLGPAICGECYEVGPEVHEALGLPVPDGPEPVDLRGFQAQVALEMGLRPGRITRSSHCTRCTGSPFFSHRGGDSERQIGYLGIREGTS
jgi:YfiH family protein